MTDPSRLGPVWAKKVLHGSPLQLHAKKAVRHRGVRHADMKGAAAVSCERRFLEGFSTMHLENRQVATVGRALRACLPLGKRVEMRYELGLSRWLLRFASEKLVGN